MEQLRTHQQKRDELLEYLSNNFDMFNEKSVGAIKKIQDYVYSEDKVIRDLVRQLNARIQFKKEVLETSSLINSNIQNAKIYYLGKKVYEDYLKTSVADRWMVNAMILIITKCYYFNGQVFKKGDKVILANDLLKEEWQEIDVKTLEYIEA